MRFPKPRPQRLVRQDKRKHRRDGIRGARAQVMHRDRRCRVCGEAPPAVRLEMHEMRSRAQLRGRPPEDIFNTANAVALCSECHRRVTERKIELVAGADGADGKIVVIERRPDARATTSTGSE